MTLLPDVGTAIGGSLVAAPVNVSSPFDGLWLVQDGMSLANGISNGDWVEGGLGAFSLLLDGVAALVDPIGTLIGMGLSWVLEHIWPLNEYLNALTGNAGEVLRMSQTWANISTHLAGAGADLDRFLGDLESLEGAAMDAYRAFQRDVAEHISVAGSLASATSTALEIASTIVKIVHDLTRDVISQIAGTAISAAITTAATVGFGAPVAIAQVAARVSALVPKVTKAIEAVIRSFEKLAPLLAKVDEINAAIKRVLDRFLGGGSPSTHPGVSTTGGGAAPPGSAVAIREFIQPDEMFRINNDDYGAAVFGSNLLPHYYVPQPTLGRPGSGGSFFLMPADDILRITDAASAARQTGMSPSTLATYLGNNSGNPGGDGVYAILFPTDGMPLARPTPVDAGLNTPSGVWPHFLDEPNPTGPWGHTAVAGDGFFLRNPTRELVTDAGWAIGPGSILVRIVDGGLQVLRRMP
jgi:hypothetical protein